MESGHGVFRPRRTPLFLLFIQKPTAAGLALARIVSQSRVPCTLTPPHVAAPLLSPVHGNHRKQCLPLCKPFNGRLVALKFSEFKRVEL
ncbi:hypothetical protein QTP88_009338 [Uroleucon formosanum]